MRAAAITLALASGLVEGSAWAQGAGATATPLEVVVTGTRTPESTQRATVKTDVVTKEEAERRGARNVGEALAGQLGVQVNPGAYGYLGGPSAIQIQGFDLYRVLVLEDGERVIGGVGGAIDLSRIPLTDVSRIEIVTGPTSALYGTGAIGGVVNVLSRPPDLEGPSARFRIEGRSQPSLLAEGSGAYRRGERWVEVDASLLEQGGRTLGVAPNQLVLPSLHEHLLALRAGARLAPHVTAQIRVRWIHDGSEGHEDEIVPGLGSFRQATPESTDRIALFGAETIEIGGRATLRLSAGRQWAYDASTTQIEGSPLAQIQRSSDTLSSFEALGTVADGPRTWVVGARVEAEDLQQRLDQSSFSGSRIVSSTETEVPGKTLGSVAAYAQLSYKLFGDVLTVMPGVRAEDHLEYGGVVAPRLAVAARPSGAWTLRAGFGRGFRTPSAQELGFNFDHSIYGYRVLGNPALAPEASWGVNGDVTYRPTRAFGVRVGGFSNWVTNLIELDLSPTRSTPGVDDYTYRNVGQARTSGVQVDVTCDASRWLRADAGYAYLWTRDDTNDRPLAGFPPHTVYAAIRAELPLALSLNLRWRAVSAAFVDLGVSSPAYSTLDARLARPVWPSPGRVGRRDRHGRAREIEAYAGISNALGAQKDPALPGDQRPLYGRVFYGGITADLPWEDRP